MYCGDARCPGNVSQLLAMAYDLKRFAMRDLSAATLAVKTGSNAAAMREICQFLEKEAYPLIEYKVIVGNCERDDGIEQCDQSTCGGRVTVGEAAKTVQAGSSILSLFKQTTQLWCS